MASEYLLEVRSQEMPADFVGKAIRHLGTRLFEELMSVGLGPREVTTGATPRRLVLVLSDLPDREPDRDEQELGPPVQEAYGSDGEPSEALLGFAGRVARAIDELETVKTERGDYLAARRSVAGRPLRDVLVETVPRVLGELTWGRRAGVGARFWVRPLCGLLSLLDGEVLAFEYGGLCAGSETGGHPILSPGSFPVTGWAEYRDRLHELGIETSREERRRRLYDTLIARAVELGGELVENDELLDRWVGSCEIPGVVTGSLRAGEITLPEEVLLATLDRHEDAFAIRRKGTILPAFLVLMDRADDPEGLIRRGQERATAGRLSDARFYYEQDRSTPLAELGRRLDQMAFHPRLGSLAEKTERLRALVGLICEELGWNEALDAALEAALLLKSDLSSEMVREFPSLRGTVGGIYAREEGYVEDVWQAIYDQYRPVSGGPIPRPRTARAVAIADRLDTLVGFLGIAPVPSASKDPFALRRLAQGLLRILIEAEVELDLDLVAARAVLLYGEALDLGAEEVLERLQGLLAGRLTHVLGRRGYLPDEIEAAMAVGMKNLPQLEARVAALHDVRRSPEFASLVQTARRISNIVKDFPEFGFVEERLVDEAEIELGQALATAREAVDLAVAESRYKDCLAVMLGLVPALDRFFADVLVMDEDEELRNNRIALLQICRRVFWRIARLKAMSTRAVTEGDGESR